MATASVLRHIARASVGLLVAGAIAGQAAPAVTDPVLPVAQIAGLAPASDPGVDPDSDGGGQTDPAPSGQTDLTPGGQADLTTGGDSAGTGAWDTATAVVTDTDGRTTTLKARTVAYCISVGNSLPLSGGQDVPFEKMSRFDVTRSDGQFEPAGKADVRIALAAGGEVTGSIDSNCDIIGYSEVGRFNIYPQKLKSVEFRRAGATPSGPASEGSGTEGSGTEGSGTEGSSAPGAKGQVAGTFEVTGTEPTAINIVTDPAGGDGVASHYNVPLPWTGEFTAPAGTDIIQVVVVGGGSPTCKIIFGGKVVAEQGKDGNGHCVYQRAK